MGQVFANCLNRTLRHWVVGASVAVLLFAQFAKGVCACPAQSQAGGEGDQSMAGMPCAAMMVGALPVDYAQPGPCPERTQAGTGWLPADPSQFTNVPTAALADFFIL